MHDLRLITAFALHVVLALLLFALVGTAAAALAYYTRVLETLGVPPLIGSIIRIAEYALFAVDMLCFLVYVGRETVVLMSAMLRPPLSSDVTD